MSLYSVFEKGGKLIVFAIIGIQCDLGVATFVRGEVNAAFPQTGGVPRQV